MMHISIDCKILEWIEIIYESELLRRRRGTGERERRLEFLRRGGDLPPLLNLCGDRLHPRLTGDIRRIGSLGLGNRIGATVTSCPSICPPSMCFIAFSASSGFVYSMYANPRPNLAWNRSKGNSMNLIVPGMYKKCHYKDSLPTLWQLLTVPI